MIDLTAPEINQLVYLFITNFIAGVLLGLLLGWFIGRRYSSWLFKNGYIN